MTPAAFSFIGSTLRRQQIQKRDARWFLQSRKLFGVNALCINIATTIKEQLTKYKVVEIKLLLARPPFLAAIQDYPSEWAIKLWPATVSLMRSKLRGQLSWLCRIGSEFVQSKALGKEDERKMWCFCFARLSRVLASIPVGTKVPPKSSLSRSAFISEVRGLTALTWNVGSKLV